MELQLRDTAALCSVNETQLLEKGGGQEYVSLHSTAKAQGNSIKVVQEILPDILL